MEVLRGDGKLLENIDLDPPNKHQEVLRNIAIILDTVAESVPMVRGLGADGQFHGRPLNVIENEIVAHVYDQIERYEPRARIAHVTVEAEQRTGRLIPIVEIEGVREDGY